MVKKLLYSSFFFSKINFALDGLFSFLLADFKQSHNFQLDDSSSDFENVCAAVVEDDSILSFL